MRYLIFIITIILFSCSNESNENNNLSEIESSLIGVWQMFQRTTICSDQTEIINVFEGCVLNNRLTLRDNKTCNNILYNYESGECFEGLNENGVWFVKDGIISFNYNGSQSNSPFFITSDNIFMLESTFDVGNCVDNNFSKSYFNFQKVD